MPTPVFELPASVFGNPATDVMPADAFAQWTGPLVPSRYNLAVSLDHDTSAVFNQISGTVRRLSSAEAERIAGKDKTADLTRLDGDLLQILVREGFLVPAALDEVEHLRVQYEQMRHNSGDHAVINILPTLRCNLACPYCFENEVRDAGRAGGTMNGATQAFAVEYLKKEMFSRYRRLILVWFGGEPLLCPDVIERIGLPLAEYAEKNDKKLAGVLVSNGVLLDEAACSRLRRCQVKALQISMDIPNAMKKDRAGNDVRPLVLKNLQRAVEHFEIAIRLNISRDDEAEFDAFHRALREYGLAGRVFVGLANVFIPETRNGCVQCSSLAFDDYQAGRSREWKKLRAMGVAVGDSLGRISGGCGGVNPASISIDPQGLVYKCVEDAGWSDRAHHSVHPGVPRRPDRELPWLRHNPFANGVCRDCQVLPLCGGGCPHRRIFGGEYLQGKTAGGDKRFCAWSLIANLEERIRERALHPSQYLGKNAAVVVG